jgi:hypothetical protein
MKDEDTGDRKPAATADDKSFANVTVDDGDGDDDDDPLIWIPKKLVSEWKNKDGIRCLTLSSFSSPEELPTVTMMEWKSRCPTMARSLPSVKYGAH